MLLEPTMFRLLAELCELALRWPPWLRRLRSSERVWAIFGIWEVLLEDDYRPRLPFCERGL